MLCEYIDGVPFDLNTDFEYVEEFLLRLHKVKYYHGDAHQLNFLWDKFGKMRVIDTQLKHIFFMNVGGHLDMHKFRRGFGNKTKYPYSKNIIYYFCQLREKRKYGKNSMK